MVGSEESWSPVGPDGSPVAVDLSACLMWDKAGEGKSAKSTAEETCPDNCTLLETWDCSFDIPKSYYTEFESIIGLEGVHFHSTDFIRTTESCHFPMSRFLATETGFIHQWSETRELVQAASLSPPCLYVTHSPFRSWGWCSAAVGSFTAGLLPHCSPETSADTVPLLMLPPLHFKAHLHPSIHM